MAKACTKAAALEIQARLDQLCSAAWSDPAAADALIEVACQAIEKIGYLAADNWSPIGLKLQSLPFIPTAHIVDEYKVSTGVKEAERFPSYFRKKQPGRPKRLISEIKKSDQDEAEELFAHLVRDFINAILPQRDGIAKHTIRKQRKITTNMVNRLTKPEICNEEKIWAEEFLGWLEKLYPTSLKKNDSRSLKPDGDSSPVDVCGYFWIMASNRLFKTDGRARSASETKSDNPIVELKTLCKYNLRKDFRLREVFPKYSRNKKAV